MNIEELVKRDVTEFESLVTGGRKFWYLADDIDVGRKVDDGVYESYVDLIRDDVFKGYVMQELDVSDFRFDIEFELRGARIGDVVQVGKSRDVTIPKLMRFFNFKNAQLVYGFICESIREARIRHLVKKNGKMFTLWLGSDAMFFSYVDGRLTVRFTPGFELVLMRNAYQELSDKGKLEHLFSFA